MMTATWALLRCPVCDAPEGIRCSRKNGTERKSIHRLRLGPSRSLRTLKIKYPETDEFYLSDDWRRVRYAALRRSCRRLSVLRLPEGQPSNPLHVDHIGLQDPNFLISNSTSKNLQALCAD